MIRVPRALFDWLTLSRCIAILAIAGGGYALLVYRASHEGHVSLIAAIGLAPIVAFVMAPALVALFPEYIGWVDERTWGPWQGAYHAFDDHPIRIVEARGRLWFSSDDVHRALAMRRRDGVLESMSATEARRDESLGDVLSNAGLARLFGRSTERHVRRFLAWAERDVRRPWQKKRDALAGPGP